MNISINKKSSTGWIFFLVHFPSKCCRGPLIFPMSTSPFKPAGRNVFFFSMSGPAYLTAIKYTVLLYCSYYHYWTCRWFGFVFMLRLLSVALSLHFYPLPCLSTATRLLYPFNNKTMTSLNSHNCQQKQKTTTFDLGRGFIRHQFRQRVPFGRKLFMDIRTFWPESGRSEPLSTERWR